MAIIFGKGEERMEAKQMEAVIWAMLRLENEIDEMEDYKKQVLDAQSVETHEKLFFVETLKKHKEHFQIFKEMVEGSSK
jgi:hypothetical protein